MVSRFTLREMLIDELSKRRAKNSLYSMSKFAKDLGVSTAQMSGVFRGQRGLSPQMASSVSKKLKWPRIDKLIFCELAKAEFSRSGVDRKLAEKKLERLFSNKEEKSYAIEGIWHATDRYGFGGRAPRFWNPKTDSRILIFDQNKSYKYLSFAGIFCASVTGKFKQLNGQLQTTDEQYTSFGKCPWEDFSLKMAPYHDFSWLDENRFMLKTEAHLLTPGTLPETDIFFTIWQKEIPD